MASFERAKDTNTGSCSLAEKEKMTFEHIKSTDVLFVDVRAIDKDATITTLDVGPLLGFPGQIYARVDRDREIIYGLTVQNYRGFRRRLLWRYRMASIRSAMQLIISAVRVGLCLDNRYHDAPALQGYAAEGGVMALEKEYETYKTKLPKLSAQEGKFVLIHGEDVVDTFTSYDDAIKEGYAKFKLDPFLVKQIKSIEQVSLCCAVCSGALVKLFKEI